MRQTAMQGTSFRDSKGVYNWKDESYPSATTILKVLDKPALPRWAANSVAEYVVGIAKKIESRELTGKEGLAALLDYDTLKQTPWAFAEKKRDMGSTFHSIAEQITLGHPIAPEAFAEDIRGYIVSFLNWMDDSGAVFEANEFMCLNRAFGYAGTCDGLIKLPNREGLTIIDFKTGKASYREHALQLAAYRFAEVICLQDGSELAMPETLGTIVLLPNPDGSGCKSIEWPVGLAEFNTFASIIPVYKWMQEKITPKELSL